MRNSQMSMLPVWPVKTHLLQGSVHSRKNIISQQNCIREYAVEFLRGNTSQSALFNILSESNCVHVSFCITPPFFKAVHHQQHVKQFLQTSTVMGLFIMSPSAVDTELLLEYSRAYYVIVAFIL